LKVGSLNLKRLKLHRFLLSPSSEDSWDKVSKRNWQGEDKRDPGFRKKKEETPTMGLLAMAEPY
jgi:hypothetical protein